jgi:CRP/FNR family transcriptional regulator, dissimilatory nitrate respiration regulator
MKLLSESPDPAVLTVFRQCSVFSGISDEYVDALAAISTLRTVDEHERLFSEDAPAHGFYILVRGGVKLSRMNAAGREQVIQIVHALDSFGEEALFSDLGYNSDATAIETSQLVVVSKAGFLALVRRHPPVALNLFRAMTRKFNSLVRLLDDLTLKDVKTRLACWLIRNCPDPTSDEPYCIELPMSKRLLASELGTIAETFSRTMAGFRKQNLVSVNGRNVTLLSPIRMAQTITGNT